MSALATTVTVPSDFGFDPTRFPGYRKGKPSQYDLAVDIATGEKRFQLLSAPTGAGKSLIYMTVAKLLGGRTLVLVGTKGLQDQLLADFASAGMVDMRGQSNYECVAVKFGGEYQGFAPRGTTVNEAPCKAGLSCDKRTFGGCHYYDQQGVARGAEIVVTSYSYWLTLGRHSDPMGLGVFDQLILDEAHTAPRWLSKHAEVDLRQKELMRVLGAALPPLDEGIPAWASWAQSQLVVATDRLNTVKQDIKEASRHTGDVQYLLREALELSHLVSDLAAMAKAHQWRNSESPQKAVTMPGVEIDWVSQRTDGGARFSPTWAHPYAEERLFRHVPRVVLASATLSPEIRRYLGIAEHDAEWHEVRTGFDPARRPLYILPVCRVDRNMEAGHWRMLMRNVDEFVGARLDRKGIIHTTSYSRAQEIVARSAYRDFMLTHSSRDLKATIEKFKAADAPAILVSPSVVEGFDFPFDEARWQIVIKVPFTDGRDPVEKARRKTDKGWGNYCASLALLQMVGRSMRGAEDVSETIIFDSHFADWFYRAVKWPGWFKAAFRFVKDLPPPIDLDMPVVEQVRGIKRRVHTPTVTVHTYEQEGEKTCG